MAWMEASASISSPAAACAAARSSAARMRATPSASSAGTPELVGAHHQRLHHLEDVERGAPRERRDAVRAARQVLDEPSATSRLTASRTGIALSPKSPRGRRSRA